MVKVRNTRCLFCSKVLVGEQGLSAHMLAKHPHRFTSPSTACSTKMQSIKDSSPTIRPFIFEVPEPAYAVPRPILPTPAKIVRSSLSPAKSTQKGWLEVTSELCFVCHGSHMTAECPTIECWRCGKKGHMTYVCKQPRLNATKTSPGKKERFWKNFKV
jgi:phage FluMu protein Com